MQGFAEIDLRPTEWQLRYLFSLGAPGWIIHAIIVMLTASVQGLEHASVKAWLAIMLVLTVTMMAICAKGLQSPHVRLFGWLHTAGTTGVALVWAAGALTFASQSFEHLLLYTLSLGGTALGAVSAQHAVIRSSLASIWFSIPGLALGHVLSKPNHQGDANAAMIVLFGLALSILAYRMQRILRTNHDLALSLSREVELSETQRNRAELANAAKSKFIAYASHDLRQPVHAIGFLTNALRHRDLPEDVLSSIGQIDDCVNALARQFQTLMDLSALELGRIRPKAAPLNVRSLLEDLVRQNTTEASGRTDFRIVVAPDLWVSTDRNLATIVVQNLISNAVKYAPGSSVLLGVKRRGRFLSLVVGDRGPGIRSDFQLKAFEDFSRDSPENLAGFGLGLSLVARYCEALGLEPKLSSDLGKGTIVEIAGFETVSCPARHPGGPQLHSGLKRLRVAIMNKDPDLLSVTERLIQGWGCQTVPFDGDESAAPEADVLIADNDPELGETNVRSIAEFLGSADRQAIILSSSKTEEIQKSFKDGSVRILQKPVNPARLRSVLIALSISKTA